MFWEFLFRDLAEFWSDDWRFGVGLRFERRMSMAKNLPKAIKEMNVNICDCDDMASVTVFQVKYMNQIKKLAEKYPDEVKIVKTAKENDGMMVAHLPKKFCKISFGEERAKREMTEEQKVAAAERMKKAQEAKKAKLAEKKLEEEGWL